MQTHTSSRVFWFRYIIPNRASADTHHQLAFSKPPKWVARSPSSLPSSSQPEVCSSVTILVLSLLPLHLRLLRITSVISATVTGGIVSAFQGGAMAGTILNMIFADMLGRRWTILLGAMVSVFGSALQAGAFNSTPLHAKIHLS